MFTNKKFNLYKKFKTIEDITDLDENDIQKGVFPIREKMYQPENLKDFCEQSDELNFTQEGIVRSWQAVYSGDFYVIKHTQNETVLLTADEKKLYGILGISQGLDELFPDACLPMVVKAKLIPFKGKIIYDGFFSFYRMHFGKHISGNLKAAYNKIKNEQGIISSSEGVLSLAEEKSVKSEAELIKYYIKHNLKNGSFPDEGWKLAKKTEENRMIFEHEYAKYFAKHQTSSLKSHQEIKQMYYAIYRDCIIGVSDTKNQLLEFCEKNHPAIANYLHIFKA